MVWWFCQWRRCLGPCGCLRLRRKLKKICLLGVAPSLDMLCRADIALLNLILHYYYFLTETARTQLCIFYWFHVNIQSLCVQENCIEKKEKDGSERFLTVPPIGDLRLTGRCRHRSAAVQNPWGGKMAVAGLSSIVDLKRVCGPA
jgi:hypothetical protein